MDKQFIEANALLDIAARHAYCAQQLLTSHAELQIEPDVTIDTLLPVITLLHTAFELTLKSFILHEYQQLRPFKHLMELFEHVPYLDLSKREQQLIQTLSRQHAFKKGVDYMLWDNRDQLHVFCVDLIGLYARMQEMVPVELQKDYL